VRTAANDAKMPPVKPEASRELATVQGQRHGQMALAALGQRWFDQLREPGSETFQQVGHRLDEFAVEGEWWKSLAEAGEQIGRRYRQLPIDIEQNLAVARRPAERPKPLAALQTAARLSRLLPANFGLSENAGEAQRRWLTQDLLLRQVQRTIDDHWYA